MVLTSANGQVYLEAVTTDDNNDDDNDIDDDGGGSDDDDDDDDNEYDDSNLFIKIMLMLLTNTVTAALHISSVVGWKVCGLLYFWSYYMKCILLADY